MLQVRCSECGREYRVKDSAAGRSFACKQCAAIVEVPDADDPFPPVPGSSGRSSASKRKRKGTRRRASGNRNRKTATVVLSLVGGGVLLLVLCCGGAFMLIRGTVNQYTAGVEVPDGQTFEQWRGNFQTQLETRGPAPQDYAHEVPPPGVEEVRYSSDGRQLMAWVASPDGPGPHPALLFCHGGFAFGASDMEDCRPFLAAGYVVMVPTWRGENGNLGNFELFLGEVDDARAAAQWLAARPEVDPDRIYAFGHSAGGGIAAVLSLLDDVPVQITGSAGGVYDHSTFIGWSDIVPFENTPEERSRRLLVGNIRHMQRPHFAYYGTQDFGFDAVVAEAVEEAQAAGKSDMFQAESVPGDHFSSLQPSMERFLRVVEQDSP